MKEQIKTVINASGIHARPATVFVGEAKKYQAKITLTNLTSGRQGDAKSMLKVLSLGLTKGTEVKLTAEGEDEEAAIAALSALIDSGLGE